MDWGVGGPHSKDTDNRTLQTLESEDEVRRAVHELPNRLKMTLN
jgi:hypothetical protein